MNRHTTPNAHARRGSALLIVIGILALVAVLGAIYISIGQSDTQSARAVTQRAENEAASFEVGSFVARTIGMDRFDTYLIPGTDPDASNLRSAREAFDYPFTDFSVRSQQIAGVQDYELFTRSGRHTEVAPGLTAKTDPRVPYDPWLGSTEPEYLGPEELAPNEPLSFTETGRVFSNNRVEGYWLDRRDWWQISNFAPDGRFVNLFNLRPQSNPFAPRVIGGFDARPIVGTYPDPVTNATRAGMTYGLTLLEPDQVNGVETTIKAFDPLGRGVWLPGADQPYPLPGVGGAQLLNTPAVWTMFQRYMFFPMNQEFIMRDRSGEVADWSSPDYAPYQYADADGDGMADSRWAELVDASDPDNIIELDGNPDYRVFFAARAMDLSALVNLNTAGDLLYAPTVDQPYGLSPVEIDLRRLLTMSDQGMEWSGRYDSTGEAFVRGSWVGSGLSLANLDFPIEDRSGQALGGDPVQTYRPSARVPLDADDDPVSGYYINFPDYIGGANLLMDQEKLQVGELAGAYAYDALRLSIERELPLDARFYGLASDAFAGADPAEEYRLVASSNFSFEYDGVRFPSRVDNPGGTLLTDERDKGERREDYFEQVGLNDITRSADRVGGSSDFGSGVFTLEDLGELLTYRGINDPAVTTRLEQTMMGRAGDGAEFSRDTTRRLSPLLSNRSLSFDRFGHGDGRLRGSNNGRGFPDARGQIDPESMALFALSPRLRLTTYNGAAPLVPSLGVTPGQTLTTGDVPSTLGGVLGDASSLYGVFVSALAPYAGTQNGGDWIAWLQDMEDLNLNPAPNRDPAWTLSYGYNTAEQALAISAHLAVNAADLNDADESPTARTVIFDNGIRDALDQQESQDVDDRLFPWYTDGQTLDAGVGRLAGTTGGGFLTDDRRRARNVFGVEPQPFLTEVATFAIVTDVPRIDVDGDGTLDGDDESPSGTLDVVDLDGDGTDDLIFTGTTPQIVRDTDVGPITISTLPAEGNHDLLMHLIAFKLSNPFDVPVTIGITWNDDADGDQFIFNDERDRWQPDYYAEFAGRFYALGSYNEFGDGQGIDASGNPIPDATPGEVVPGTPEDEYPPSEQYVSVSIPARESRIFYALANNVLEHGERPTDTGPDLSTRVWDFKTIEQRWEALVVDAFQNQPQYLYGPDGTPDTKDGGILDDPAFQGKGPGQRWIEQQLTVDGNAPVRVREFDPEIGHLLGPVNGPAPTTTFRRLDNVPTTPVPAIAGQTERLQRTGVVRLWKRSGVAGSSPGVIALASEAELDEENPPRFNAIENDLLADRLWDPDGLSATNLDLFTSLGAGGAITGTVALDEDIRLVYGNPLAANAAIDCEMFQPWRRTGGGSIRAIRNDNTGWTAVIGSSIRRRGGSYDNEPGIMAPWVIAPRPALFSGASAQFTNTKESVGPAGSAGSVAGYTTAEITCPSADAGRQKLWSFVTQAESGVFHRFRDFFTVGTSPMETMAASMDDLETPSIGTNVASQSLYNSGSAASPQPELFPSRPSGAPARIADLLTAIGVGPVQAPSPLRVNQENLYDVDAEWLTLSEMLAIALGYDVPTGHNPSYNQNDDAEAALAIDDPYVGLVNDWSDVDGDGSVGGTGDWRYVLPNLQLAIDDYVSFFDENGDGRFTPAPLGPATDLRAGSGIPMALDVLGRVRMHAPKRPLDDPGDHTLTRVVPGTININTAPASTLRLLPGLSPSFQSFEEVTGPNTLATRREWWAAQHATGASSNSAVPNLSDVSHSPDIAASIVAYRDRLKPVWRRASHPDLPGPTAVNTSVEFRFDPLPTNGFFGYTDFAELAATNYTRDVTRGVVTGVPGLRESPGFRSTGEVLAVTLSDEDPFLITGAAPTPNANFDAYRHNSIQAIGLDSDEAEVYSVGSSENASFESDVYDNGSEPDALEDDLGEKLALANNVLGSITVSSDVYAVWYIVHGYRESDVSDLRPGDPLVPSYARRYVMVVDRSNVKNEGDAPRIVYLREVPM
ncbi:MAG: hypothetical protein RIB60_04500 [Phycisphaerales bacterium]